MARIILASGSPRRRQLLAQMGLDFDVVVSDADETITGAPDAQVAALALRKAEATRALLAQQGNHRQAFIIAADTLVALAGASTGEAHRILGKPANAGEAFAMLSALQGCRHTVYTGVALLQAYAAEGAATVFVEAADVYFRSLTPDEIHAYIATGEPFDKAGAYGIQEKGALLVARIEGDFYTVMGLPIARLGVELGKQGIDIWNQGK